MNKQTIYAADKVTISETQRETEEGYLIAKATLARTGIQEYHATELGIWNMGDKMIKVYRPPEEVFKDESLATFQLKPVTDNHPDMMVDIETINQVKKGHIGQDVAREGDLMTATILIHDKELIEKVKLGKVELSNGYYSDYLWESGVTPNGENYDAIQSNIRGNHVAVVAAGRCGGECRILDAKPTNCQCNGDKPMPKIKIGGVDCEMSETAAQVVQNYMDSLNAEIDTLKSTNDTQKAEYDTLKGTHDATKQKLEDTEAKLADAEKAVSGEALDALVAQRTKFLSSVAKLDSTIVTDGQSEMDVIKKVLASKCKDYDAISDKSDDYLRARFDGLVSMSAADASFHADLGAQGVGNNDGDGEGVSTVDDARAKRDQRNRDRLKGGKN